MMLSRRACPTKIAISLLLFDSEEDRLRLQAVFSIWWGQNVAVYPLQICTGKPPGWADVQLEMHKICF